MPIYLTPILGSGTDRDAFQPIGLDRPGTGWIDLRPDPTVAVGRGLLWLETHDPDPRLLRLVDAVRDSLSLSFRTQLGNQLGITLRASRMSDVAAEILGTHARTDGTRWRPLMIRHDGAFEIHLGTAGGGGPIWSGDQLSGGVAPWFFAMLGCSLRPRKTWGRREFLAAAGIAASLLLARRAESAILNETWPTPSSTISSGQDQPWNEDSIDVEVASGALRDVSAAGSNTYGRCLTNLLTDNHQHRATAVIVEGGVGLQNRAGVGVRKIDSTAETFYDMIVGRESGIHANRLRKHVTGTVTNLVVDNTNDAGSPVTITCQANGSSIFGNLSSLGNFGPFTDTAITGNLQVAYMFLTLSAIGAATLDDHVFNDLGGLGAGIFGPVPLRTILGVGQ